MAYEIDLLVLERISKKYGISSRQAYDLYHEVYKHTRDNHNMRIKESNDPLAGKDALYTGSTIRTFTGQYVNVFDPKPETIVIEDIAHALSQTCRFGGHTYIPYSVAQHSIEVSKLLPEAMQLTGLMHDATEAYMCDLPRPIKRHFPEYKEVEERLMQVIADKFKLTYPFPAELKKADKVMLEKEHDLIIRKRDPSFEIMNHSEAKAWFLIAFKNHNYYEVHDSSSPL